MPLPIYVGWGWHNIIDVQQFVSHGTPKVMLDNLKCDRAI